jgi:hypothetical protein
MARTARKSSTKPVAEQPWENFGSHKVRAEALLAEDPSLKVPATGNGIVTSRKRGDRWEYTAVYAGVTVGRAKELFTEKTGLDPSESYTGRGRNFGSESAEPSNGKPKAKPATRKPATKAKAKAKTGVKVTRKVRTPSAEGNA